MLLYGKHRKHHIHMMTPIEALELFEEAWEYAQDLQHDYEACGDLDSLDMLRMVIDCMQELINMTKDSVSLDVLHEMQARVAEFNA